MFPQKSEVIKKKRYTSAASASAAIQSCADAAAEVPSGQISPITINCSFMGMERYLEEEPPQQRITLKLRWYLKRNRSPQR